MVTTTVVAPRAVPLTTRLIPVPVEPAAGEVISTRGLGAFAAWAPAGGQTTKAVSSAVKTQTARREVGKRIRPLRGSGDTDPKQEIFPRIRQEVKCQIGTLMR